MDRFHRFSSEKAGGLHEILVCRGSLHVEIGWRSLCFALRLLIVLVYYLFIYYLFVCLLFNYFKGPVFWFMHELFV